MFVVESGNISKYQRSTVLDKSTRETPATFTLGRCRIDGDALSVTDGARVTSLEPRAYRVLRYLAERPNKLITIDELMDVHWEGTIVTPNSVTRVIAQLRKALNDDARNPEFIETVARTGYRLIANVSEPAKQRRSALRWLAAAMVIVGLAVSWWFVGGTEREPTVAVLPFENFTGDDSLEYIGDGVAEEVINALAKIPELRVIARSLSFRYKGAEEDPREFSRDLDVAYFVEGSVRRDGQKIRFTAQLIDVESGYHVWSHTAQHDKLAVFEGQDAISKDLVLAITEELDIDFTASSETRRPDPEAYNLYLRGRQIWHRRGSEPLEPAVDHFSEAVKIDPEFARGWAALASAYISWPSYSPKGFGTFGDAEKTAQKALDLDPDLAEPYAVLGTFAQNRRQWHEAHRLYSESIRRNDRNATAQFWYSEHLLQIGHINDSFLHLRRAMELDPLYRTARADVAWAYLLFGDSARGAEKFRDLWESGFQGMESWIGNYTALINAGDYSGAFVWLEQSPMAALGQEKQRRFLQVLLGESDDATLVAEMIGPRNRLDHRDVLFMTSRLGRYDATFEFIRKRIETDKWMDTMMLWDDAAKTRQQAEFPKILDELGLIALWDDIGWGDICRLDAESIICDARDVNLQILEAATLESR